MPLATCSARYLLATEMLLIAAFGAAAEAPAFVVHGPTGLPRSGPLVSLDDTWTLTIGTGVKQRFDAARWLTLTRQGGRRSPPPGEEQLILANGDRVPARDLRLDDEKIAFRHPDLNGSREVTVPLSSVAAVWRLAPDRVVSAERFRNRLVQARRRRDVVHLRNGDSIEGTWTALRGGQVEMDLDRKTTPVRWSQVAAIGLSSELTERVPPGKTRARLCLAPSATSPGGRFTLAAARCAGDTLTGTTVFGAPLSVPLERVEALDLLPEGSVELPDLQPTGYVFTPYLDERWGWSADANLTGRDLTLGGSAYSRGIGMHAASRLSYPLDGRYRRFIALVGLDDRDGKAGRVRLRVEIDGKPAKLDGPEVRTHADAPLAVNLNVEGARTLTLQVDYAGRGGVQAVVNWVHPRLLR